MGSLAPLVAVLPPPSRLRELQEQARERQRERVRRMTSGERMEEAFRLYLLAREAP